MTIHCLLIASILVGLAACGGGGSPPSQQQAEPDLLSRLKTRPSLTRFTAALEATGVADRLRDAGPYTIFAPIDAAIADRSLDQATVNHHIVAERVTFNDIAGETISYTTLHTDEIEIDAVEVIRVGDGMMIESDITASNGVIHVIDKVLSPSDAVPTNLKPAAGTNPANGAAGASPVQ